jgi:hypothetical protein
VETEAQQGDPVAAVHVGTMERTVATTQCYTATNQAHSLEVSPKLGLYELFSKLLTPRITNRVVRDH